MSADWPPSEQAVIDRWTDSHYPDLVYSCQMPVDETQPHNWYELGSPKLVDLLLYPEPSRQVKQRLQRHVIQTREGVKFVQTDSGADVQLDEVRFFVALLKAWPEPALPVRIFEAKQQLDMTSIGQILTYSTHFADYYHIGQTRPEIVERGIVYATGDSMVAETARDHDISLYSVAAPKK
jgi:hypothetical protein